MSLASAPAVVLVIRTVSVEKLDGVLAAGRRRWPQAALHVLSTAARRDELLQDHRVAAVEVAEPGPDGYAHDLLLERHYTAILLPVGNRSGTGYANVMRAVARCHADAYFLAPYAAGLREVTRPGLRCRAWVEIALLALAFPLAWLLARRRF